MAIPNQNIEVDTYIADAYCYKVLTCIHKLTDGESFNLWDSFKFIFAAYTMQNLLLIISDQLCLSILTFCTISVIGISVKSHIGTPLDHACILITDENCSHK